MYHLYGQISPVKVLKGLILKRKDISGTVNITASQVKENPFGKPVNMVMVQWFENPINNYIVGSATITKIEEVIEQTYLLDSEGYYLVDSEGYYLTV